MATDILVVDCFSTDDTVRIARDAGARELKNQWIIHATQFNWALEQVPSNSKWVLRNDGSVAEVAERICMLAGFG